MATIFTRSSALGSAVRSEKSSRSARAFSFSRLLDHMSSPLPGRLDGYEGEMLAELRRGLEGFYNEQRFPVPLQLLADPTIRPDALVRDLSKGTLSAGGYLVGTDVSPIAELLQPWSVSARAGVSVIGLPGVDRFAGDLTIPKVGTGVTTYWLANESATLTASDPSTDKLTLTPKTGGALTRFSRLMAKQGNVADALLQRELLRAIGQMLDTAILAGSGGSGQPTGIKNFSGVATSAGAFSWTTAAAMEQAAGDNGGDDSLFGFVTTPAVRKLLKLRTLDASSAGKPLWVSDPDGESLAGRQAHAAPYAPASTIISGPWSDCVLAMWGVPTMEVNRNDPAGFKVGTIEARMLIDVDVGLLHPAAWTVHTSVT